MLNWRENKRTKKVKILSGKSENSFKHTNKTFNIKL